MPSIFVAGHPVGKGRARFVRATGHAYTPKDTVRTENLIGWSWKSEALPKLMGGVSLEVTVYLDRPKLHYGTGRNAGDVKRSAPVYPIGRPDGDNLLKVVMDGLNGVAWYDDSQVVDLSIMKRYSTWGSPSGWRITVEGMGDAD